jgi:hypothetical protein
VSEFTPPLQIAEVGGAVRLGLAGFGYVEGATLQDAADELVRKLLVVVMAFRSGGGGRYNPEFAPDAATLDFLWELGEIAASGGDIRERLFGSNKAAA